MDIDITPLIEMSLAGASERGQNNGYDRAISDILCLLDHYSRYGGYVINISASEELPEGTPVILLNPFIRELEHMRRNAQGHRPFNPMGDNFDG